MRARYAFRLTVRFETPAGTRVDPETVDVRFYREADPPGQEGWLFFRDNCWRGELADPGHFRELVEEDLDVPVESAEFAALETDEAYLSALRDEISTTLATFNADDVDQVLKKYLGSSIEVRESLD